MELLIVIQNVRHHQQYYLYLIFTVIYLFLLIIKTVSIILSIIKQGLASAPGHRKSQTRGHNRLSENITSTCSKWYFNILRCRIIQDTYSCNIAYAKSRSGLKLILTRIQVSDANFTIVILCILRVSAAELSGSFLVSLGPLT